MKDGRRDFWKYVDRNHRRKEGMRVEKREIDQASLLQLFCHLLKVESDFDNMQENQAWKKKGWMMVE